MACLLIEYGADPNQTTLAGKPTAALWRDVRTSAESPLHREPAAPRARCTGRPRTLGNPHYEPCLPPVAIVDCVMRTAIRLKAGRVGIGDSNL